MYVVDHYFLFMRGKEENKFRYTPSCSSCGPLLFIHEGKGGE